ncbi:MAG: UrcA family protein [Brevundimonas sp.]
MNGILKGLTVTVVSVAAVCAAAAAYAQTPGSQPTTVAPIQVFQNSVRVSFRDLDLATEQGMDVMRGRIHRASYEVCDLTMQPLYQQLERLSCASQARRGAFDQLASARRLTYAQADRVLVLRLER